MEEARARWERLPTINELMDTINSVPWKCEEKAKALNIPFTWLRDADHDIIISDGLAVGLWSSSSEDSRAGQYIYLFKFAISAANSCGNRGCGRLVRPFLDK